MSFSKTSIRVLLGLGLMVMTVLVLGIPSFANADLNRQLEVGMSGSDVSAIQAFLAQDSSIYPEGLITGYFGYLTKAAVVRFQSRNGISAVGRIGPVSLPVFNAQMASGMINGAAAPQISNVSVATTSNSAVINWNTNEFAKGVVYYSSTPLITYERTNSVDVSGNTAMTDTNLHTSQSVSLSNLSANTTYYYLVYATDQGGNVSVSWPATFHTIQ
ncbi:MAG TPA: peptidoglycan-binding protein [Candidatus Paceibacterota bacterium]